MAVAVVCASATTFMALMVYRLQAESSAERFKVSADIGFASDFQQARTQVHRHGGDRLETVSQFVREREGMHWALYDFLVEDDRPLPVSGIYPDGGDGRATAQSTSLGSRPGWLTVPARVPPPPRNCRTGMVPGCTRWRGSSNRTLFSSSSTACVAFTTTSRICGTPSRW